MEELKQQEETFSLKQNCKNRLKSLFDQMRLQNKGVKSYLLIVDAKSLRMISSYMTMMELMELDVLVVEKLEHERKAYQVQHAIYFITPSQESISLLNQDFKDKKNYQYGFAHVFLTNKISQRLMRELANNQYLMERLKTFKEFNQDFMCKFDNTVNLDIQNDMPVLFSKKGQEQQDLIELIASKLTTVVTSLEKFYGVEIIYNRENNKVSELIANSVQERLYEVISGLKKDENQETLDKQSGKVTLIILDRSYDVATPVVRDFFYMPMLYDLQDIDNDLIIYKSEDEKGNAMDQKAILSDSSDHLFPRYQFKHIAEVMEGIPEEFQQFAANNTTAQVQKGDLKDMDFNTMADVIKKMPKYKLLLAKYTMHIQLIQSSWEIFEKKDLATLGEIEQTLATGIYDSGKKIEPKKILSQIITRLQSDNLNKKDKIRLVVLATVCLDISESDRKVLTQEMDIEGQKALKNLYWLGVSPQTSQKKSKSKGKFDKKLKKQAISKLQSQTLSLCRHTSSVETLLNDLLTQNDPGACFDNGLPLGKFKNLRVNMEEMLGRSINSKKTTNKKKKLQALIGGGDEEDEISNTTPKIIIFIAGGMTYSELRALKNLQGENSNFGLILGGTSFIKPNDFINKLASMESTVNF